MPTSPPSGSNLLEEFADYVSQADAISRSQATATFDLDGLILSANLNFLEIFGYTWPEIEGRHHSIFVERGSSGSPHYWKFWSSLKSGHFQAAEYKRVGKDGREIWLQASYNPVLGSDGQPFKIVKLATDVTERKRIQAAFAGQLAAIEKSQAVIEFGLDGTILNANQNFLAALGYKLEELQGKHHRVLVDPDYRHNPEYLKFWESLSRGEYKGAEYKRIRKDGGVVWFQGTYNPVFGLDGKAHKVVKLATDITEKKLKAEEYADHAIAISRSQAVIEFDMYGNVLSANENYLAILGYSLDEIEGRRHSLFVDPAYSKSAAYKQFWDALRKGEYQVAEFKRVGKNGREVWLQASYNPILDLRGAPYKVVKVATDTTARKLAEMRVAALQTKFLALLDTPDDAKLRLFQGVVIQITDGVVITEAGSLDAPGPKIVYANPAFTAMTGYAADEIIGKSPRILQGPLTAPEVLAQIRGALESWQPVLVEVLNYHKNGTAFWAELNISPICDENGRYTHWISVQRDITDRKRLEEEMRHSAEAQTAERELLEVTLKSIGDGVVCTDEQGNVTFSNVVAEELLGIPMGKSAGPPTAEILRMINAAMHDSGSLTPEGTRVTPHLPADYTLARSDGCRIAVEGCVAAISGRNSSEIGKVIVFRDVSAARAIAHQTKHAAYHDTLTDLPNRLLLSDRIAQAIALTPRNLKTVAVLFLDLDGFKDINDSLGHAIGDKLLTSVGSRLMECVRVSDTVSRLGGDEFVVMLAGMSQPADAGLTAQHILQAVGETHSIEGHDLHVTASIGISVYPDDGHDAATLIKAADTAMYRVKASGRHGYQFFEAAMEAGAKERKYIEESLLRAIKNGEFALHYQPRINIKTGAIAGAEALIRWPHLERGSIAPGLFIHDCGLIRTLDSWVLREACKQGRLWTEVGMPITMAVNVSSIKLGKGDFLGDVQAILRDTGFDPKYLELEMTERVLMKGADSTNATLTALKVTGLRVAIDDFGTGYSSLNYLTKLPIDTIKIDQSFVHQISTDLTATAIVTAIISMAHSLNLNVVAEGVETREQLDFLLSLGCDEAQGCYFSRPVAAASFTQLLSNALTNQRIGYGVSM